MFPVPVSFVRSFLRRPSGVLGRVLCRLAGIFHSLLLRFDRRVDSAELAIRGED
jgi:hypothetical protein